MSRALLNAIYIHYSIVSYDTYTDSKVMDCWLAYAVVRLLLCVACLTATCRAVQCSAPNCSAPITPVPAASGSTHMQQQHATSIRCTARQEKREHRSSAGYTGNSHACYVQKAETKIAVCTSKVTLMAPKSTNRSHYACTMSMTAVLYHLVQSELVGDTTLYPCVQAKLSAQLTRYRNRQPLQRCIKPASLEHWTAASAAAGSSGSAAVYKHLHGVTAGQVDSCTCSPAHVLS
jgi:hypothetical protein